MSSGNSYTKIDAAAQLLVDLDPTDCPRSRGKKQSVTKKLITSALEVCVVKIRLCDLTILFKTSFLVLSKLKQRQADRTVMNS